MNTAIYAGTFDPITNGHVHIVERALKVFEKVIVVVANNPTKKSMFNLEERLDITKKSLSSFPIEIDILPDNLYLVDYAESKNVRFLVRGIRDTMDFNYEYQLDKTNKQINPNIETIYLMPDKIYERISSGWIKSVLDKKGWTRLVDKSVPVETANALKKKYVEQRLKKVATEGFVFSKAIDIINNKMKDVYSKSIYHNYSHIISMLERLDMERDYADDNIMYLAAIMHDLDNPVEKCAKDSGAMIKSYGSRLLTQESPRDRIERLILATDHPNINIDTMKEDAKILASIDLMILASNPEDYKVYASNIRKENSDLSDDAFNVPRKAFLQAMLDKKIIFPSEKYEAKYGNIARENMRLELSNLSV